MVSLRGRLAVLFGLWAVGTLAPPMGYLFGGPFGGSVGLVEVATVMGLFGVGTATAAVGLPGHLEVAERFRAGFELGVPMLLAAITLLAALPLSILWGVLPAVPFALGGTLGFLAAFLVGYEADQTVIERSRASTDEPFVWHARKRPEADWFRAMRVGSILAAVGLAVLVGMAGGLLLAGFWLLVAVVQTGLLALSRRRRQYELTDAGLITAFGHLPWEQFEGYELTDEALVLYGSVWPFGTIAYDRPSIDSPETVCETIDQYLPQRTVPAADRTIIEQFRRLLSS